MSSNSPVTPVAAKARAKGNDKAPVLIGVSAVVFLVVWGDFLSSPIQPHLKELPHELQKLEVELRTHADRMRGELRNWAENNEHLKKFSDGKIGWQMKAASPQAEKTPNVTDHFFNVYNDPKAQLEDLKLHNANNYIYLIIPGLFTRWYPGYMSRTLSQFESLGLDARFVPINTDLSFANAEVLRDFILSIADNTANPIPPKMILLGHSKGAVDATAAISLYPEIRKYISGVIALQAPFGGATIANDLFGAKIRRDIAATAVEIFMRGDSKAVADLTYASREEFLAKHPYPSHEIPTVSLATSAENMRLSLLAASVEYVAFRYTEASDGCVAMKDAVIPGSQVVYLTDMDHFGPAWYGFPSLDTYDPVRLKLILIGMLLKQ